jgi:NAD(P)-dependent dehydrogenase (short-subunit alcohol dehydrogenase family)
MPRRFDSRVVLISGATSGIGAATARRFAEEGAKVVCVGRNSERGTSLIKEIESKSGDAYFIKSDVKRADEVKNAVKETIDAYGRLHVLFNNAGVGLIRACDEMGESEWDNVIDTNLKSVFLFCKYSLPWLKKTRGVIINNGSDFGLVGSPNRTAYCASKGGIVLFTKALALECAQSNVRVNCVCPGPIETEMLNRVITQFGRESILMNVPLRRIASPEEVATIVLFLASDEARYVTGATVSVDGGTTAK